MRKFSISVDIAAPPQRVAEVMCDPFRWNEWTPSITSVTRLSDGPFAVGSTALVRQPSLPPARWKVTKIDPTGFTWESAAPGLRVAGHHYVVPTASGSRATLSLEYFGLFGGLLASAARGITERYIAM